MECVGLAVLGDLPAMRQVGDDRLAAVARVAPDQVVEHASLGAQVEDGSGLVHIEMRRPQRDAYAQDAAALRVRLGRGELKRRAVEFGRYRCGSAPARGQPPSAPNQGGGAAFENIAAGPPWLAELCVTHKISPLSFRIEPGGISKEFLI